MAQITAGLKIRIACNGKNLSPPRIWDAGFLKFGMKRNDNLSPTTDNIPETSP
ncbi:MAG: hypothetical protein IJ523_05175 [Succinivibrionaceae bacterium]|nr:hypothetical protein [Succinivibrionaceae bacterium]